MTGKLAYVVVALVLVLAVAASIAHAQEVSPQYFTCTEVVPGVSNSTLSHVIVWLSLSNVTTSNGLLYLLDQLYYNPTSPYFHHFITPQEFAEWYSPPSYVFSYITSLAESYGLTVNYTFPMLIEATGNASAADNFISALQMAPSNVTQWIIAGECIPLGYFTANSKAPNYKPTIVKVPLPQGVTVQYILQHAVKINGKPAFTVLSQPSQQPTSPIEVWYPFGLEFIYDELPLFGGHTYSGYTGQGLTIAIVDAFGDFEGAYNATFTGIVPSKYVSVACQDLALFSEWGGLPYSSSQCIVIYPTGVPILTSANIYTAAGWSWETALDIEYAHTMAPGAKILLVISPDSGDDLFVDVEYVVNNSLANFISLSWGAYEDMFYLPPPSYNLLYGYDEIFMQAAAEGIGVFAASGDSGAFDTIWLRYNMPMEASVSYPASDPWVTSVGGTTLYAVLSTPQGYVIRNEFAWNWKPFIVWGTGGGYSFTFPETSGQVLIRIAYERTYVYEPDLGVGFYTTGMRGVPDIAADANPLTGVHIVLNGVIPLYLIGGTSLAAPLSAGMTATIQSYLYGTGVDYTIGDLAPNLYLLYYYPSQFYASSTTYPFNEFNITGIPGAMFMNLGGQNGLYWVITGQWNPVDGLGQINVYGLAQSLDGIR